MMLPPWFARRSPEWLTGKFVLPTLGTWAAFHVGLGGLSFISRSCLRRVGGAHLSLSLVDCVIQSQSQAPQAKARSTRQIPIALATRALSVHVGLHEKPHLADLKED
jgi:hypothetical protein